HRAHRSSFPTRRSSDLTPFDIGLDRLLSEPGRAAVIAAGNSGGTDEEEGIHFSRLLHPDETQMVTWEITNKPTDNKVDIWYDGEDRKSTRLNYSHRQTS